MLTASLEALIPYPGRGSGRFSGFLTTHPASHKALLPISRREERVIEDSAGRLRMRAAERNRPKKEKLGEPLPGSTEHAPTSSRSGMTPAEADALLRENVLLKTRLTRLSEASRRVSENLDLDIVLNEIIENACYVTGALYGALLTYDQSGDIRDFITSGLSPQEIEGMNTLPRGLGLLGHISEIREPLTITDIASHPSSVGFPKNHPPMKSFLGMPIRHRGEHVGNIYVAEKDDGGQFTAEDQEVLVMFASQAGAAISIARTHREEQQAHADLKALVNISPVAVLVFDGKTGDLLSFNDETRRMVGNLNAPGRSHNQLLEVMALRRTDGSDIPLDELPIMKALKTGETVIADEIVIHPPAGRAPITTLVNARPVRGANGDIVSVVATMQDITPLEEMKRQRAQFLNDVSHELRTPLTAIKGSASTLLGSPLLPDPVETRQFLRVIDEQSNRIRNLITDLVDLTHIESGMLSISPEPTEIAGLLDLARESYVHLRGPASPVELDIPSNCPRVMADKTRILQVLDNILLNVTRRSSRSSTLRIRALRRDMYVAVAVVEEGAGTATARPAWQYERFPSSTHADEGRNGDDKGIAISRGIVEAHGGRLTSQEGKKNGGRGFTFTIPVVEEAAKPAEQAQPRSPSSRTTDGGRARVLVIAENTETRRYVHGTLTQEGIPTAMTGDPNEAEMLIAAQDPQLVLFEPTLPWSDAFEMLGRIGSISDAPVIFVTGHGWDQQIGRAFELGAVDYIAKPFTATELVTRIELALRRGRPAGWREASGHYWHDGLSVDYAERKVTVANRSVNLTVTEYKLLTELSRAAGRVLSHEQLLSRVWGPLYASDARILRQYIKELRRKLGDLAAHPKYIFTEPGVGYRMAKPSTH